MRNSADIQAHSISIIKDNRVVSLEDYITEIAGDGGGNVDLSNYYNQTETDNLLNAKLNVNNPQDIIGNLRLDSTNGNGKIIINAVSPPNANDDFYCNGSAHINGTLRVSVLTSDGDINADGCNADTFNSHITTHDIIFNHNDVEYMRFSVADDELQLSKNIDVGSSTLHCNTFDSGLSDVVFNLNSNEFLRFQLSDNTVRVPNTKSFLSQNIFTDIVKPLAFANDISLQGQNSTSDGYEEYVKINSTTETVDFHKDIDVSENIIMQKGKFLYFDETGDKIRYITSTERSSPSVQNHLDIVNMNSSQGRIRLLVGNTGSDEQFLVDNTIISCKRNLRAGAGLETNNINSVGANNLNIKRNGTTLMTLNSSNQIQLSGDLSLPTSNTQ